MTTEFNELLTDHPADRSQIWLIGTREQVMHLINECYVKGLTDDRAKFTPIIPLPFGNGKYMTILVR
ncbi:MAG: hypothetical protein HY785_22845 [Oscillatoriophycideae cyanobacterium NC_groundwater_1537_Pr4_S-0.65um_50_18]|nr:hypothetical protein [Oscillatoriophycideae cyanobacterium NC_groundwater_1537_Pr4_S-0.65um_50_18]MBI4784127.1 hypothetical protein [Oscillatoriophycideae cyanobacterium NC_groundwater_1537_Pr4_S-0.65um_50_18]